MSAQLRSPRCPTCGAASQPQFRPFCSVRCKQVDLGRWLSESYRLPAAPLDEAEADSLALELNKAAELDKAAGSDKDPDERG